VVVVPVAGVLDVVVVLDVAAPAIAAPPPASAPVTARVVRSGFSFRTFVHLLLFDALDDPAEAFEPRRR
jgi:hypothetical protein